jgi:RimJ/RimL family protein N-acetyltransferase
MLSTAHRLRDGSAVRLRLTRPSDAPRVRSFLETLSEPARYRRFLSAIGDVPESVVRHFTFYEPRERLMLAATTPADGSEAIVALADVAMLDTGVAEIAVVVGDAHQGLGIGTLLGGAVASLAAQRGATHLKAVVASDNEPMLRLMERLGETVRTREDSNVVAYTKLQPPRPGVRHAA